MFYHANILLRISLFIFILTTETLAQSSNGILETKMNFTVAPQVLTEGILSQPLHPKAIALILPGSGAVGIDGDVSGPLVGTGYQKKEAKLSEQLAFTLGKQGIASLRYAKRGFDHPEYAFPFSVLKSDAKSAALYLKGIYPKLPLYLVGISEGALLAIHLAPEIAPAGVFLFSPPPGPVNTWLHYLFVDWAVNLLSHEFKAVDGKITQAEFSRVDPEFKMPLFGLSWRTFDANQDGALDLKAELLAAYENYFQTAVIGAKGLAHTPTYQDWYQSLVELEDPEKVVIRYSGRIWHYVGMKDAQASPVESLKLFELETQGTLRKFDNLGHCFSPHEGKIGESKTSGPIDESVLMQFGNDLEQAIKP